MANLIDRLGRQVNFTKEFGPYSKMPIVYISYESETRRLIRVILEEGEDEEKKPVAKPEDKNPGMGFWKGILYYLFLYNPPETEPAKIVREITGEEKLAESTNSFLIEKRDNGYYIKAE